MSPHRSEVDRRTGKVWVYLTAGELTQLRGVAKRADLTVSAYVRMLVKEALFRVERAEAQERLARREQQGAFELHFGFPVETRPEPRSRIEEWRRGVEDGADPRTL